MYGARRYLLDGWCASPNWKRRCIIQEPIVVQRQQNICELYPAQCWNTCTSTGYIQVPQYNTILTQNTILSSYNSPTTVTILGSAIVGYNINTSTVGAAPAVFSPNSTTIILTAGNWMPPISGSAPGFMPGASPCIGSTVINPSFPPDTQVLDVVEITYATLSTLTPIVSTWSTTAIIDRLVQEKYTQNLYTQVVDYKTVVTTQTYLCPGMKYELDVTDWQFPAFEPGEIPPDIAKLYALRLSKPPLTGGTDNIGFAGCQPPPDAQGIAPAPTPPMRFTNTDPNCDPRTNPGNAAQITVDSNIGTDDFTLEYDIMMDDLNINNSAGTIISSETTWNARVDPSTRTISYGNPSPSLGQAKLLDGQWTHITIERSNGQLQGFANGVPMGEKVSWPYSMSGSGAGILVGACMNGGIGNVKVESTCKICGGSDTTSTISIDFIMGIMSNTSRKNSKKNININILP